MQNKTILLKIILVLIVAVICISIPKNVQASTFKDVMDKADKFVEDADGTHTIDGGGIKSMISDLFGIVITAGAIIALIITAILGVKFIFASAEGKAEIKETMTPYVIGCIVTFAAYAIWKVSLSILNL